MVEEPAGAHDEPRTTPAPSPPPLESGWERDHARRYLEARYGTRIWFRAPETIENILERWIWAVSAGEQALAEECTTRIERHFAGLREAECSSGQEAAGP